MKVTHNAFDISFRCCKDVFPCSFLYLNCVHIQVSLTFLKHYTGNSLRGYLKCYANGYTLKR